VDHRRLIVIDLVGQKKQATKNHPIVRANHSAASRTMVPTDDLGGTPGVGSPWREFEKGGGVLNELAFYASSQAKC
jgi:hypothetical protein